MDASGLTRAFVAVVPPADVRDAVAAHLADVDFGPWKPARPEQWHLTLEFLGRVDDVDAAIARLRAIAGGLDAFEVQLGGAGAFPAVDRARVLWLGVNEGAGELRELAAAVRDRDPAPNAARAGGDPDGADHAGGAGTPDEGEPFVAHLTVARAARPRDATELVGSLGASHVGPSWTVDAIELISSETHPDGARYTTVVRLPRGGELTFGEDGSPS